MRTATEAMQDTLAGDSLRLIRLIEMALEQGTYRYGLNIPYAITWNGLTWNPMPGQYGEIQESAERQAPQFALTLQNLDGVLGRLFDPLVGGKDPRGRRVTLREITEADAADADAVLSDTFVIESWSATRAQVALRLGAPWATEILVPSRRMGGLRCSFIYKGPDCGSLSAESACPKTPGACAVRNTGRPLPFSNPPTRTRPRRAFFV